MSKSGSTEFYLHSDVTLKASQMGARFWNFDADETVEPYFGGGAPSVGDYVTGSALYTDTFEAREGFRFDLSVGSSIEATGANASIDADAYVILWNATTGFELVSASGASYLTASAVPKPPSYGALAGPLVNGMGLVRGREMRK